MLDAPPSQDTFDPQRAIHDLIFASAPQRLPGHQQRGGHRGGSRGGPWGVHGQFHDRRRNQDDKPKHRHDIPDCAPWVLVRTKFGRRFVWNKDTNESFWKFPQHVMTAVVEYDRKQREKKERRERGEPSDDEQDEAMAEIEAELAEAEEKVEIVEVDGEDDMENDEEYEEVEVTDDEDMGAGAASKRQRTEEPSANNDDDDLAWQLAQMEEMENMAMEDADYAQDDFNDDDDVVLTEEDCKTLFKELLDDLHVSPYTPWSTILDSGILYDDERYKALPNMAARKDCFNEWSRAKSQLLKEQKAQQSRLDPRIPYLAFLDRHANPKLYWPEFRRKFKKEAEMKDGKLSDKDKEKLYREHVKRMAMRSSDLKSDLSALLRAQPLAILNRSTTLDTLPQTVLSDIRFISLPPSSRESLIETYIMTLPSPPPGAATEYSAEEQAQRDKQARERERRENALQERERRVREEKKRQERDLAYGKGRLREEEEEIERALNVGKSGLKAHLETAD